MSESRPTVIPRFRGLLFVAGGLALGLALVISTQNAYAVQNEMAAFAAFLPVGYAFSAGMVAAVNPCGVMLLPSILAFYLGAKDNARTPLSRTRYAAMLGFVATAGFLTVFTVVGAVIGVGGRALAAMFPVGGFMVGLVLTLLGIWLALTGKSFGVGAASRAIGVLPDGRSTRSFFAFGIGYAISSLACTLPVFLVVAGSAIAREGPVGAAGQFVGYALGMGSVLTLLLVSAALFEGVTRRWLRSFVPWVHQLSASFLIGAGIFVAAYWFRSGILRW